MSQTPASAQVPDGLSSAGPSTPAPPLATAAPHWAVSPWMKVLFFWCSVALVGGLVWHKVSERARYESLLVETVMDPMPVSPPQPAPAFSLQDGDGKNTLDLASLKGHYVFLNFWATWCPPCRDEMPSLEFLARKFGTKMEFVTVTVDEDWNEVKRFFHNEAPSFRVLWDPKKQVSPAYGTTKFPETYILDPQGRIIVKFIGPRDWNNQASEEYFQKLLGG